MGTAGMIDTHVHLDFPDFRKDIDAVIRRAEAKGIETMICVGIDEPSSRRAVNIAKQYRQIWATVGAHPHDAAQVSDDYINHLRKMAENPKVLAVGEAGLDYYRDRSPRDKQQKVFREQISLAREIRKPIIIHCRDAYEDMMKILKEEKIEEVGAVLHCYSGDVDFALESIDMGLYISFSGTVTYPNAKQLREVVSVVPLDNILIETDAPFLSPVPYRGKRNEPAYIEATYDKVAELKKVSIQDLCRHCRDNLQRLTGISLTG